MNYANMIEEKNLKKGFILATLASTIAGTFITGINLYDRVAEKRKQNKLDNKQDQRIKDLERRVSRDDDRPQPGRQQIAPDDVRASLNQGNTVVQREYDEHYARLGPGFAQGDTTSQLQLQSQIITLQATVIKILQDALYSNTPPDLGRLYNASEFARESTVRVLRDQYRRLLSAAPPRRPAGPIRHTSSTPSLRGPPSVPAPKRLLPPPSVAKEADKDGPLFCRVAVELQGTDARVAEVMGECGDGWACRCGAVVPGHGTTVEGERVVQREYDRGAGEVVEIVEMCTFLVTARFIAKCHREGRGFACWLCWRGRESDTLSHGVSGLVGHVGGKHRVEEWEGEGDIRETYYPRSI
ncbi:hypothetical protein B0H67DRAFT_610807 [Lasiosphaeris hirsuta]|uniref:Uncharacterized protein n=1 Tax=Lasiosphaeris hirsuta TaxID=260670 RepID=A0AA40AI47_9PEZI|nr:hypothetical protein B0H67DRAFT_610807 [Lasiosphaeris hirsuta]